MVANNPVVIMHMAHFSFKGEMSLQKDERKVFQLLQRALEVGSADACYGLFTAHNERIRRRREVPVKRAATVSR